LAEISSSITIGAVLQKAVEFEPEDKVVFLISSGNIGIDQFNKFENIDL
jgi:hypothetical protein